MADVDEEVGELFLMEEEVDKRDSDPFEEVISFHT